MATLEYDGYLFVPDIGLGVEEEEELNVINLKDLKDQTPILFGWPYFEGSIDNDIKFSEIYLWMTNKPISPLDFIQQNSVRPSLYYQHNTPDVYRAAIIREGLLQINLVNILSIIFLVITYLRKFLHMILKIQDCYKYRYQVE